MISAIFTPYRVLSFLQMRLPAFGAPSAFPLAINSHLILQVFQSKQCAYDIPKNDHFTGLRNHDIAWQVKPLDQISRPADQCTICGFGTVMRMPLMSQPRIQRVSHHWLPQGIRRRYFEHCASIGFVAAERSYVGHHGIAGPDHVQTCLKNRISVIRFAWFGDSAHTMTIQTLACWYGQQRLKSPCLAGTHDFSSHVGPLDSKNVRTGHIYFAQSILPWWNPENAQAASTGRPTVTTVP
uniref:Uncharacterized protein n=1 Tax=mine drainage metagenome TaxID=410659 RepID=E6QAB1_9ZZZZ